MRDVEAGQSGVNTTGHNIGSIYRHSLLEQDWRGTVIKNTRLPGVLSGDAFPFSTRQKRNDQSLTLLTSKGISQS